MASQRHSKKPNSSLTAAFVKNAPPGKHHDGKGMGLFLLVKKSGSRSFVQRIVVRGKRREIGLGAPPIVTLAEAREKALENKRAAYRGSDPLTDKNAARNVLTFEEAARRAHAEYAPALKNPKDRAAYLKTMETYIFPRFGTVLLPEVSSADVRRAILAVREKAPGVAKKLIYRVSSVFKWGIAEGICTVNPAITEALALPKVEPTGEHRKALHYSEVAHCIEAVKASGAMPATKLALEFLVLTATRSGETRGARWDQFEFEGGDTLTTAKRATWTLQPSDKKEKRAFRLPLPDRALEILKEAEALADGSGLVFPGAKAGRPLSDMTLSKLVKQVGFEADVHGFRTSFRTWTQERTNFPREVAEAALAHKIGDAAEQAYARSDVFEKRRRMMEAWSGYLLGKSGNIVVLNHTA
ncbi:tyrosine-type recombinase/integrase [Aliiroseovarius sp. KMU-71]|uniref:tyrosine-type recombinase/integrase n=1 Tax=Aliiroseovarius sp. KMU-71 TaxID=3453123 RepID=UPI003F487415